MFKNDKADKGLIIISIGLVGLVSIFYLNLSPLISKIIAVLAIMLGWVGYFIGTRDLERSTKKEIEKKHKERYYT